MRAGYELLEDGKAIRCLDCKRVSHNPNDVLNRYCGFCHHFHRDHRDMTATAAAGSARSTAPVAAPTTCFSCGVFLRGGHEQHLPDCVVGDRIHRQQGPLE